MSVDDSVSIAKAYLAQVCAGLSKLDVIALTTLTDSLRTARREGRRVYAVGNGGSASVAAHFALSLTHDLARRGASPISAFALTDPAALTAISNDESAAEMFVSQLRVHLQPKDVVVAFSCSGASPNVLRALSFAAAQGALTAAIVGMAPVPLSVDICLQLNCPDAAVAEDLFAVLTHAVIAILMRNPDA